jgi:hypothetical protein
MSELIRTLAIVTDKSLSPDGSKNSICDTSYIYGLCEKFSCKACILHPTHNKDITELLKNEAN